MILILISTLTWYDIIWYMIWCDVIWYDMIFIWYAMIWYDTPLFSEMKWHDMIWICVIWYVSVCPYYCAVIMSAMASQITSLTIVYSTVYSRRRSKKTSKVRVTGLCAGNSPVTGEFPAQRASNAEMFPFWWRHHVANLAFAVGTPDVIGCFSHKQTFEIPQTLPV